MTAVRCLQYVSNSIVRLKIGYGTSASGCLLGALVETLLLHPEEELHALLELVMRPHALLYNSDAFQERDKSEKIFTIRSLVGGLQD